MLALKAVKMKLMFKFFKRICTNMNFLLLYTYM